MKRSHKIVAGIALSLSLGLAAVAFAYPGGGPGPHMRGGYGMMGFGPGGGHGAAAQLMTPEEHAAFREKMAQATPEERVKLMAENHAEMQKRAADKGITMGQGAHGSHGGFGPGAGPCWMQGAAQ